MLSFAEGFVYFDEQTVDYVPIVTTAEDKWRINVKRATAENRHGRRFKCDWPPVKRIEQAKAAQVPANVRALKLEKK